MLRTILKLLLFISASGLVHFVVGLISVESEIIAVEIDVGVLSGVGVVVLKGRGVNVAGVSLCWG